MDIKNIVIDTEITSICGVDAYLVLNEIYALLNFEEYEAQIFEEGNYWVAPSINELHDRLEYLSVEQIEESLTKLEKCNILQSRTSQDNFYNRIKWYSYGQLGHALYG